MCGKIKLVLNERGLELQRQKEKQPSDVLFLPSPKSTYSSFSRTTREIGGYNNSGS
jgi:hypothetical protein